VALYRTIVADPPWPYGTSKTGRWVIPKNPGEEQQRRVDQMGYSTMSLDELKNMSIASLCDSQSHLYLWTTNAFMVEAHELAKRWGFHQKTILTWGKVKDTGEPSMKTGYYFRGATEHCLFCVRGSLRLMTTIGQPTLWLSRRLPHSVKPEWLRYRVDIAKRECRMNAIATTRYPHKPAVSGFFACGSLSNQSGGRYMEATTMGQRKGYKQTPEHVAKRIRTGKDHHSWKGDDICERSGRTRAGRIFDVIGPCEKCGKLKAERHHKDGNTANNSPANIEILCRRCHMIADGRLDALSNRYPAEAIAAAAVARKAKTHCKRGHPLSGNNLYEHNGKRICKACNKLAVDRYQSKKKEQRLNGNSTTEDN